MEAAKNPRETFSLGSHVGEEEANEGDWIRVNHRNGKKSYRSEGVFNDVHGNGGNKNPRFKNNSSILERMSMSFYVTNFPSYVTNKDLGNRCSEWGSVVDVFIANRLSKVGKRFGFVRFIKVSNAEALLSNLNSMWFAKYKVFVDVMRFNRSFNNRDIKEDRMPSEKKKPMMAKTLNEAESSNIQKSYADAVTKTKENAYVPVKRRIVKVKSMSDNVTDSLSILLKVTNPDFIPLARRWFHSEGFLDLKVNYIGGRWLFVTFNSPESKKLFVENDSYKSRFGACKNSCASFVPDERMVWIEIHGLPRGAWYNEAIMDIIEPWGKGIFFDCEWVSSFSVAKVCILSNLTRFIFEEFTVSLDDRPYVVWIKEFAPWEPKILSPMYGDNDLDSNSCDDSLEDSGSSDDDYFDDNSQHSIEFDANLCKESSADGSSNMSHGDINSKSDENGDGEKDGHNTPLEEPSEQNNDLGENGKKISTNVDSSENVNGNYENVEQVTTQLESEIDKVVADCKIPSALETEVFPDNRMQRESNSAKDNNDNEDPDDIFSLDRIIRKEMGDQKPPKSWPTSC